ncbi:MAG: TolC family protein [Aliidongia sp.]
MEERGALEDLQKRRFEAAYLTLTGDVASQAFAMASARAQIGAVQLLLADDRRNLELVRVAHLAGSVTQIDVSLVENQLAQDETLLPPLVQQRDAARHALSVLAGQGPADWVAPDFDLTDFRLPPDLPVTLPSELAHNRPDIRSAEAELHAASAGDRGGHGQSLSSPHALGLGHRSRCRSGLAVRGGQHAVEYRRRAGWSDLPWRLPRGGAPRRDRRLQGRAGRLPADDRHIAGPGGPTYSRRSTTTPKAMQRRTARSPPRRRVCA